MSEVNTNEVAAPVAEKKKRILKPRPLYTLLAVTDADGNVVDKAQFKVQILAHSRSAADLLKLVQANPAATLIEHTAE